MKKLFAIVALTVSALFFSLCAYAEDSEFAGGVQLRLKNSLSEKVDYYFTPPGDKPKLAGSLEAGASIDVKSRAGIVWLFAQDRKPFQKYTTREEVFQQLTIAPIGQQKKPVVANAYQPALKSGKKTTGTANVATTKPVTKKTTATTVEPEDPSGLKWTAAEYEMDGGTVAELIHGVPETDQVQVYASCRAESAGAAHVIIGWDVAGKPDGQATRIRIVGTGFDRSFDGQIYISESGEGVEGAEFDVPVDDKIWGSLKSVKAAKYNVGGKGAATLSLAGIAAPLNQFLQQCAAIGGGSQEAATLDARTLFGGKSAEAANEASCEALRDSKSTNDGESVGITFVNQTEELRVLDWIDHQGRIIQYGQVEPGQSFEVETFTTHPWMATDGPGNCIEMFMPSAEKPVIKLTRKSPGFGDE